MRLTNDLGLPEPVMLALQNHTYDRGECDFTVTQLLDPPRKRELTRLHRDEITEDASERIYALLGSAVHTILERANRDMGEVRLYLDVAGKRVGGKPDHFTLFGGVLSDYKVASVWEWIYGTKVEREQQLNAYAELFRANGHDVTKVQNVMIFRDWSKSKARREDNYPQRQVCVVPQEMWEPERVRAFLAERVALHMAARVRLPNCTADERWERGTTYAVVKLGNKRAVRVFDTDAEARAYRDANHPSATIDFRPGESIRCQDYCAAAPFCEQWKAIRESRGVPSGAAT